MDRLRESIFGKKNEINNNENNSQENNNLLNNNINLQNSTLGALSSMGKVNIKNTPSALSWIIFLVALIFSLLFI